jgi:hypothetical protein
MAEEGILVLLAPRGAAPRAPLPPTDFFAHAIEQAAVGQGRCGSMAEKGVVAERAAPARSTRDAPATRPPPYVLRGLEHRRAPRPRMPCACANTPARAGQGRCGSGRRR